MSNFGKLQDYKQLQTYAEQVAKFLKLLSCPVVEVKPVDRGKARLKTRKITIPVRVLGDNEAYKRYYVAHEVCHFSTGLEHSRDFKHKEDEVVRKLWGIGIIRYDGRPPKPWQDWGVYPVRLVDLKSGEVIWSRK